MNSVVKLPMERIYNGQILICAFKGRRSAQKTSRILSLPISSGVVRRCSSTWWIRQSSGEAQRHPEKHRDLFVRVSGYSAEFIGLSEIAQDEIISRTEYEMHQ